MLSAVNPRSNGLRGGSYNQAFRPTDVGGGGFASPGTTAATPPGVPNSGIIEARNNRGSNIRIPYARLVPMHARQHPHERNESSGVNAYDPRPKDKRLITVNGKPAMEYDGLVNAELAWILGRRFKNFNATGEPGTVGPPPDGNTLDELSETQRYAHQAYAGLGSGVDRMQRLASTAWIENMVATALGNVRIDLHEIVLGTPYQGGMDSLIHDWSNFLFGTATMCADPLAQRLAADIDDAGGFGSAALTSSATPIGHELRKLGGEKLSGVLFLEKGPFLRGFQVDTEAIDMSVFKGHEGHGRCSRNIGDACVMSAIELEIRRRNLMDWTPDGIILSKLESPTDEPHKSIEMDARSAQLFNVAVQGPAISTTWTSDVRDFKLECQPMDKVFICLVADVSWTTWDARENYGKIKILRDVASAKWKDYIKAESHDQREQLKDELQKAVKAARDEVDKLVIECEKANGGVDPRSLEKYTEALRKYNEYKAASSNPSTPPEDLEKARKDSATATEEHAALMRFPEDDEGIANQMAAIDKIQDETREGSQAGAKVVMYNFRLKRSTSSHMINYSKWDPKRKGSRLDLQFGTISDGAAGFHTGGAEYIVGAWCIGTVLDSAASRSAVGSLVRTAPTSMALNINVNIEWWSSDKLYKHYMDRSGLTMMRNEELPVDPDDSTKRKRSYDDADLDRVMTPVGGGSDAEVIPGGGLGPPRRPRRRTAAMEGEGGETMEQLEDDLAAVRETVGPRAAEESAGTGGAGGVGPAGPACATPDISSAAGRLGLAGLSKARVKGKGSQSRMS